MVAGAFRRPLTYVGSFMIYVNHVYPPTPAACLRRGNLFGYSSDIAGVMSTLCKVGPVGRRPLTYVGSLMIYVNHVYRPTLAACLKLRRSVGGNLFGYSSVDSRVRNAFCDATAMSGRGFFGLPP
jgi:hypothetical protein